MSTDHDLGQLLHAVVPEPPPRPALAAAVERAARRRRATLRTAGTALAAAAVAAVAGVVWPGSAPAGPDTAGGASTAATAAEPPAPACPNRGTIDLPPSPRVTAAGPLVPGSPTHLTVCWYPTQASDGSLRGQWVLDATQAAAYAGQLNALHAPVTGGYECPMDDGSTALLIFQYRDGDPVWVKASLRGCQFVTNGARAAYGDGRIPNLIERLR